MKYYLYYAINLVNLTFALFCSYYSSSFFDIIFTSTLTLQTILYLKGGDSLNKRKANWNYLYWGSRVLYIALYMPCIFSYPSTTYRLIVCLIFSVLEGILYLKNWNTKTEECL